MDQVTEKNRIGWIDTARALMIFFIVLGHTLRGASIYNWLYSFHVPMSIMISGMVFLPKGDFWPFVKKKFIRLMLPYYAVSLVSIAIYAVLGGAAENAVGGGKTLSIQEGLIGMLWANGETGAMRWNLPLWYIPMCFAMDAAAFWLIRTDKSVLLLLETAVSVMIALVVYSTQALTNLPFCMETVIYLFPFMVIGKLLRKGLEYIQGISWAPLCLLGVGLLTGGTFLYPLNGPVQYVSDQYGNYLLFLVVALLIGCGFVVLASIKETGIRVLNYIGRNTLEILLLHKFPIMFFVTYVAVARKYMEEYPLPVSIVIAGMTIGMCLIAGWCVRYSMAIVINKRKAR